ncbi:MAG: hypothetical protein AB7Q01_14620 [Gammaproteobacteria bacterium]
MRELRKTAARATREEKYADRAAPRERIAIDVEDTQQCAERDEVLAALRDIVERFPNDDRVRIQEVEFEINGEPVRVTQAPLIQLITADVERWVVPSRELWRGLLKYHRLKRPPRGPMPDRLQKALAAYEATLVERRQRLRIYADVLAAGRAGRDTSKDSAAVDGIACDNCMSPRTVYDEIFLKMRSTPPPRG